MSITKERAQDIFEEEIIKALFANLPLPKNIIESPTLGFTRAKTALGNCKWRYNRQDKYNIIKEDVQISISKYLLEMDEYTIRKTIAHELCHACPGDGHGLVFKKWAKMLDDLYNYGITRLATKEESKRFTEINGLAKDREQRRKYAVQCPSCGAIWHYTKMTRVIKYPDEFSCAKCHQQLIRIK